MSCVSSAQDPPWIPSCLGKAKSSARPTRPCMSQPRLPAGLTSHDSPLSPLSLPFLEQSKCTVASEPLHLVLPLLEVVSNPFIEEKGGYVDAPVWPAVPDRGDTHVLNPATMSSGILTISSWLLSEGCTCTWRMLAAVTFSLDGTQERRQSSERQPQTCSPPSFPSPLLPSQQLDSSPVC